MEWAKYLGVLFGLASFFYVAFRWGRHIGLIENQMQIEGVSCRPPAKKFPECNKPATVVIGGEPHTLITSGGVKVKLILQKGKVTDVICNYLNRQTGVCEWCEEKPMPCKYFPKQKEKGLLKTLLSKVLGVS